MKSDCDLHKDKVIRIGAPALKETRDNTVKAARVAAALFNPEMSVLLQKCPSYTGNLNSETPGDSKFTWEMF
jgi:hypothetical protein